MYRTDSVGDVGASPDVQTPATRGRRPVRKLSLTARAVKRLVDVVGAVVFFTMGLPLYLLVALGVKFSSPGPVHYWQYRVGRNGRRFRFYKFRSMYVDGDEVLTSLLASDEEANSMWEAYQKLEKDPRITPFGRLIRRASLDELPQFWNVLKGDMSLVGPRPCMEQQDRFYGRHWESYCAVKPGLTGLWQVSGRSRLSYSQRVRLDARYVQEWSMGLDLKILLKTVSAVISGDGSH